MNCRCSKISNHGLYLSLFKFLNQIENLGLNSRFSYSILFKVLHVKVHFLSAQIDVLSSFLQVFIVLEMYNFPLVLDCVAFNFLNIKMPAKVRKFVCNRALVGSLEKTVRAGSIALSQSCFLLN